MATYRIYMRSFAPWREFGAFTEPSTLHVPLPSLPSVGPPRPYPAPPVAAVTFGGAYHGDARGFSVDTASPGVTARINAYLDVNLSSGSAGVQKIWCDESRGPWMTFGPGGRAVGTAKATFSVSKSGQSITAIIDYGAPNPLVRGAPDIDARGEFILTTGNEALPIDAIISGDQFPACESFIQDPIGNKVFLGGFAPQNKG